MKNSTKIGFIGAGNMASALATGLLNFGIKPNNIKLSDVDSALLSQRADALGVEVFTNNAQMVVECDVIILAVKPQILSVVCKDLAAHLGHQPLIISIAAGVRMNAINRWLGGNRCIVRTMPNTPALLAQGVTAMFANGEVSGEKKALSEKILGVVGYALWVENEAMLDAVTALSGSGPAYFFLLIEAMTNAGVALGLDEKIAQKLSVHTALGASMMASNSSDSAQQLRAQVTSKNGTTEAAIHSLQTQNFAAIIAQAMRMACERATELGDQLGDD